MQGATRGARGPVLLRRQRRRRAHLPRRGRAPVITDRRLPAGRPDGQLQSCALMCYSADQPSGALKLSLAYNIDH